MRTQVINLMVGDPTYRCRVSGKLATGNFSARMANQSASVPEWEYGDTAGRTFFHS